MILPLICSLDVQLDESRGSVSWMKAFGLGAPVVPMMLLPDALQQM